MANIQVRNVPDEVHERLKSQAAAAGQSLNEYLLGRMTEMTKTLTIKELIAEVRKLPPYEGPSMAEIAAIVREGRDSR